MTYMYDIYIVHYHPNLYSLPVLFLLCCFDSSSPNFCRRPVGPPVDRVPPSWEVDLEWRGKDGEIHSGYRVWEKTRLNRRIYPFWIWNMYYVIAVRCMSSSCFCFWWIDVFLECCWLKIFLNRVDSLHSLKVCIRLFAFPVAVLFYADDKRNRFGMIWPVLIYRIHIRCSLNGEKVISFKHIETVRQRGVWLVATIQCWLLVA